VTTDNTPWIGVDFDETLAYMDRWRGIEHTGEPIPMMLARVKAYIADGFKVKIFTARVSNSDPAANLEATRYIQEWCVKHGLPPLEVTNQKDYFMIRFYDDRARQVLANTGIVVRAA